MKVKAATGLKVPMEGKPMTYIDDANVVEVPDDSAYYARRISDGDLVEVVKQDKKKGDA